ncbi:MAG: NAD(P)/FAD-dependent oxidoreductase [Acholeplasma sp.]|nr:NAD(P)/FAD-dependent oxidoreductase [Acholeplasma sp.]
MYDTIIIGAGPVGLYAASLAGINNLNACLIESASEYGGRLNLYKDKMVYDMPGFSSIKAKDLTELLFLQYKAYEDKVLLHLNTKIERIEPLEDGYLLITESKTFETKTILLANGGGLFQPIKLDLKEASNKQNLHYTIKDINAFKNQELVVLGGGDAAVDWALALHQVAKKVTLVHRRNDFRAHESNVIKVKNTLSVLTPFVPSELKGDSMIDSITLKNVETENTITLKLDALFVFYGSSVAKNSLDAWGVLHDKDHIIVSSDMQTSKKNIYAIGNGIDYKGKRKMIVTGLGEAATAISAITQVIYPNKQLAHKH